MTISDWVGKTIMRAVEMVVEEHRPVVLITDDNEILLEEAYSALRDRGIAAIKARNGVEAVEISRAIKPAFILMDADLKEERDKLGYLSEIRRFYPNNGVDALMWTARREKFEPIANKKNVRVDGWIEDKELTDKDVNLVRFSVEERKNRIAQIIRKAIEH